MTERRIRPFGRYLINLYKNAHHGRRKWPSGVLFLAVAFLTPLPGLAERVVTEVADRPKVGLALSGGGARGAAHLGVIRVLEENNVPIDYIAGTSMGAIVGGLYSSGLDAQEIEDALGEIDWDDVFDDRPARSDRSFRRKRDDDLYLAKMKPGFNQRRFTLPRGLVQGQKIDLALAKLIAPVAMVSHFDQLPIPFRAVASDIATGEVVVLDSGNLATAIRASMSIPAAFSPATIDGRLLVDGGVSNNLPIDVVRGMGADVVIAVDISTPLLGQDDIDSVVQITQQLTGLLTRRNVDAQLATLTDRDLLIVPDLTGISTTDFKDFAKAIGPGRRAAEDRIDELHNLRVSDADYRSYLSNRGIAGDEIPVIDRIHVENNSRLADGYVWSRLNRTHAGVPLDVAALEQDLASVYGLELFQNVGYHLTEVDGETVLNVRVDERSWGPGYLQFGVEYDSNGSGETLFNVGISHQKTAINPSGGEWRSALQLGSEPAFFTELHQPLPKHPMYFVNPILSYEEQVVNLLDGGDVLAAFDVKEWQIGLGFGREFGQWGEARMGIRYGDGRVVRQIGDPAIPEFDFNRGEMFVRLALDEWDSLNFPRNGSIASAEWIGSREALGADSKFEQLRLSAGVAYSRKRTTLLLSGFYDSTIVGTAPIQSQFRLGGFARLSGFSANEISGQHAALIVASAYRKIADYSLLPVYGGVTLERGNAWNRRDDISFSDSLSAGSVWIGTETVLGPLYLAYGRAEGGRDSLYFFMGRPF